jgi:carbon storage regulator CsrA
MLVLKRKTNEAIYLDTQDGVIQISVSKVQGKCFSIAISAPRSVNVRRHDMKNPVKKDRPLTQATLNDYLRSRPKRSDKTSVDSSEREAT